jgi:hypothetical protein
MLVQQRILRLWYESLLPILAAKRAHAVLESQEGDPIRLNTFDVRER